MLYPNNYLTNPNHKIKVIVVGCGGTGSRVLVETSSLSQNLVEMGNLGFEIHCFDPDIVEQHNIGRQMFYQSDLNQSKSKVLSERINRSYGDNIKHYQSYCSSKEIHEINPDIIITCVDNVSTRRNVNKAFKDFEENGSDLLWIDTGNDKNSGQVIMGILDNGDKITPTCVDLFPNMKDDVTVPSCSTKEALKKQSFMINKFIANFTIQFLANIFIEYQIPYSQLYFNSNPYKIKTK